MSITKRICWIAALLFGQAAFFFSARAQQDSLTCGSQQLCITPRIWLDHLPDGCEGCPFEEIKDRIPEDVSKAHRKATNALKKHLSEPGYAALQLVSLRMYPDSCCSEAKLVYRYQVKVQNGWYYRFSLLVSDKGKFVDDDLPLPEGSTIASPGKEPCEVVETVLKKRKLNRPFQYMQLVYHGGLNRIVYEVYGKGMWPKSALQESPYEYDPHKDFIIKKHVVAIVDAYTGEILEYENREDMEIILPLQSDLPKKARQIHRGY